MYSLVTAVSPVMGTMFTIIIFSQAHACGDNRSLNKRVANVDDDSVNATTTHIIINDAIYVTN